MEKYGIENVRGGSYSQIQLSDAQVKEIKNKLVSANDRCYECGESGHLKKNCLKGKTLVSNKETKEQLLATLPPNTSNSIETKEQLSQLAQLARSVIETKMQKMRPPTAPRPGYAAYKRHHQPYASYTPYPYKRKELQTNQFISNLQKTKRKHLK